MEVSFAWRLLRGRSPVIAATRNRFFSYSFEFRGFREGRLRVGGIRFHDSPTFFLLCVKRLLLSSISCNERSFFLTKNGTVSALRPTLIRISPLFPSVRSPALR